MNTNTIPGAEPFFFPGGEIGCLLVHGFTGAPKEMRELGEFLHKQGYTVLGVRLAGHATNIEDMIRCRNEDWLTSVEDGWNLLSGCTKRIFLMGLSMGGILSLVSATRLPAAGVVAMSTPYIFPHKIFSKIPWALRLISPFYRTQGKGEGIWFTPGLEENHISYERDPVRPAYELALLLEKMRACIPEIRIPAMVIQSKDDDTVPAGDAEKIYQSLGSQQKQLLWTDHANHIVTRDGDTSRVFQPINEFIQTVVKSS